MFLLIPTMFFRSTVFAFSASVFPQMVGAAAGLEMIPWVLLVNACVVLVCAILVLLFSAKMSVRWWALLHFVGLDCGLILCGSALAAPLSVRLPIFFVAAACLGFNESFG